MPRKAHSGKRPEGQQNKTKKKKSPPLISTRRWSDECWGSAGPAPAPRCFDISSIGLAGVPGPKWELNNWGSLTAGECHGSTATLSLFRDAPHQTRQLGEKIRQPMDRKSGLPSETHYVLRFKQQTFLHLATFRLNFPRSPVSVLRSTGLIFRQGQHEPQEIG